MNKVIRDGNVAVLYSPGFGAGWYSWNENVRELLFDPEIVSMVENNTDTRKIVEYVKTTYGDDIYTGGSDELKIEWIPVGSEFIIREHDGSESIELKQNVEWIVA